MQGIVSVWRILTPAKKAMLIAAVGATVFAFSMLARTASNPRMDLLYSGLDGRAGGEVVSALERMNVPYQVRGESIYVPAPRRDAVRMALAGDGLPSSGQAGFELLKGLNGFATTADMFDATYWRAKEGELARTILTTPGVRAARVHIGNPSASAFARSQTKPTAAVTVTMGSGRLTPAQAQAIRFLVASAVPGLAGEAVAIMDSAAGVILSPGDPDSAMGGDGVAAERETRLEKSILNLLEARVGPGNARVQVALDIDMEREAVSERVLNPDGRVVSGRELTEVTETTSGGTTAVSAASNLPGGDAAGGSRTQRSETKETVQYDMTEVTRQREKLPGSVRRISVAVFVNQIVAPPAEEGEEPVLRSEAEIDALRDLVSRAAGLDEARGDILTIHALPFQAAATGGAVAEADPIGDFLEKHLMHAIQIAVLSIVTLVLGLFVVKPLLMTKEGAASASAPATLVAAPAAASGAIGSAPTPAAQIAEAPDAIVALKEIASSKTDQTAMLIKSWLETTEDAA